MQVINRMEGAVWFPHNAFKSMALRLHRDRVSLSHNPLPTLLHPFPNAALLTTSLIEHPLLPDVRHRPDRRVHLLRIWPAQPLPTAWSHRQWWHLRGSLDWHVCRHLPLLSVRSRHCRHHEVQQENSSGGEALKLSTVGLILMDCFFFPETVTWLVGQVGAERARWEVKRRSRFALQWSLSMWGARMSSTLASPEDSSTENPQGSNLEVTLLSIFQIRASLPGVGMPPAGMARSYLGQGRDRLRTWSLDFFFSWQ